MSSTGTAGLEGLVVPRPPETSPRPQPIWDESIVVAHDIVGTRYHRLTLRSPEIAATASAGQFVMVSVPESAGDRILLPRPMAIHRRRVDRGMIELIFNVVGRGTSALSTVATGDRLLITGPLGRGFEIPETAGSLLLIGRGIGVCAVMGAIEDAVAEGRPATAVLSANTRSSIIGLEDCAELGAHAIGVADEDGTSAVAPLGARLRAEFAAAPPSAIMVCGSSRLTRLAADLAAEWGVEAQVSLEAHMACGIGYCHGCAAPVASADDTEGPLVCVDGPVFDVVTNRDAGARAA
ncbi:dihydroorotate dehydrogenase electron transfer subunit [Homoserinimonas aerilata]|uniref:Dihydroorotate dehydrogenase electron transfer subunit n=1 Tax=Homoserinimonas aerilata TaxID=1162970 RepID=A0A542YA35_9MICO|nr:FAD-binding oxidoreductase [Homoserinimonas aerilata]TQL44935.1 dihydroorotate dehydrogenase electron transfer subunit [Homoserinimonas aerilata]